ncbi:MAG: rod shape-determining protein MreC [Candidatus Eisenbacteria bacterium]|nr:rod shape-determining protein MreC [Candidatus Eisenbacteria bacterium]
MFAFLARLFTRNRELAAFAVCAAISLVLLALPQPVRNGIGEGVSTVVFGPFRRLATYTASLQSTREENMRLRELAVRLAEERSRLLIYRSENERLRELLSFLVSFPEEERFRMLPARVIGMPGTRVVERLEIDRGVVDGVRENMPVVLPEGVVGKISTVMRRRSLVEPLTSASSAVSVVVERSRVRGVVRPRFGSASDVLGWHVDYVPARSDVRPGDRIVTSGLGGVYPPGLAVGTVTRVAPGPLTMHVEAELAIDLATVEQVFILTSRTATPHDWSEIEAEVMRQFAPIGPPMEAP